MKNPRKRKKREMTTIRFQIGDWSNDGHGHCDTFNVECSAGGKGVRRAYKAAQKKLPRCLDPAHIFRDYEDSSLSKKVYEAGLEHGFDFLKGFKEGASPNDETLEEQLKYPQYGSEEFLEYIFWYLKQGDPALKLRVEKVDPEDVFPSYGEDGFGYGLFSS